MGVISQQINWEPYMDHCGMSGKYGGVFEIDIPQKTFKDFVNIIEVNK